MGVIVKGIAKEIAKNIVKVVVKPISWIASTVSTVVNWIDTNVTFGLIGFIGRNTIGRVYQFGNWIYDKIFPPKIIKDISAARTNEIIA